MLDINKKSLEKVIIVGLIKKADDFNQSIEYLDELEFLVRTAGGIVVKRITQKMRVPNPKTFIGSGKLHHIKSLIKLNEVSSVVFDDELTATQQFNLEKLLKSKIMDRTALILDIFAQRAKTSYARTQVELAQYEYFLPRLKGLWTHLERQRGGIGMRGPGETEIETDRRIVRDKISLLKKKLISIDKQMKTQRNNRGNIVRVALVGYTNVGKSTLMNILSKSNVFAENKLFATLDTTVRKVVIEDIPFLLSDTVGFIRKLPTQLIESFKSTLDEIHEADLLLHVVDISHDCFENHINSVNLTLKEIGCSDKKIVLVFNKIDAYVPEIIEEDDLVTTRTSKHYTIKDWEKTWMSRINGKAYFISALKKEKIDDLKKNILREIKKIHVTRYPFNNHFLN